MPVKWIALQLLLLTLTSCYPDKECAGDLVFDDATAFCYKCPTGSVYKNETCECAEGYAFIGLKCVLMDGAMPIVPDEEDAGGDEATYEGSGCKDYCSFATMCIGTNVVAMGFLADVVTGLHADNAGQCETSCKSDLGSAEATDPALACITAGKDGVMCHDPDPQKGLENTFDLVEQCCEPNASSPLCNSICTTLKANQLVATMVTYCP
jgi:hypothetical protein